MRNRLNGYLWRLWLWLAEAENAYITLAVVGLASAFALCRCSEPAFRYTGLALQIMGVGTVAWGIRETRKLFKQPHLSERFIAWLARWPRWELPEVTAMATASIPGPRVFGWGTLTSAMPGSGPLENRLKALEANVTLLIERTGRHEGELRAGLGETAERIKAEAEAREKRAAEIENLIRTAQTGGLDLSLMGLVWLAVGLLITTGSLELKDWCDPSAYSPHTDFVELMRLPVLQPS